MRVSFCLRFRTEFLSSVKLGWSGAGRGPALQTNFTAASKYFFGQQEMESKGQRRTEVMRSCLQSSELKFDFLIAPNSPAAAVVSER